VKARPFFLLFFIKFSQRACTLFLTKGTPSRGEVFNEVGPM
jgi:hypothetical protein